ncbi:aminopeptidase [Sporosarcina thermotolerans]|uniref:Aminopeptidase n=1 Tax=Sporosarcina thermotolerans TaxID=633404 RepID=A0AAW9AC97_9BACL|nr:aminopeptidase [Sporosarcina thermotolerans]MDW0117829.1 aminopeptidase [Sporosarcina thermotolerans]
MLSFEQKLENYASLIAEVGANIQKDQTLFISASIETVELVRKVADKAYSLGARQVIVDWADEELVKLRYEKAPAESFSDFPEWKVMEREKLAEGGAAFVSVVSQSPDLLKGIEPSRIANAQKAAGKALSNYRKMLQADRFSWSVVAAPSKAWAAKMFPELEETEQVPALWEAIFSAVRADVADPVAAWKELDKTLNEKADYLNKKAYATLQYRAPGTNLTIDLPKGHIWCGGGSVNVDGNAFMANMPTEEVFTVPHKDGVNGYVKNTKPLSYGGNIIDDFTVTFEDGRITEISAGQGEEVLQRLIDTDEGAKHLGEVALVPHASPISESGLLFYNTLFDENASNHLAIGSAYSFCLEGGKTMSTEDLEKHGLNQSITHVDFMIGSAEMDIDGVLPDGTVEPVFRNGNWAF